MNVKIARLIVKDLLQIIEEQISDNLKGHEAINSEYWVGRIVDSEEIQKKIIELIIKYDSLIENYFKDRD